MSKKFDPYVIRTRNLLIWSQTRYRCAKESLHKITLLTFMNQNIIIIMMYCVAITSTLIQFNTVLYDFDYKFSHLHR